MRRNFLFFLASVRLNNILAVFGLGYGNDMSFGMVIFMTTHTTITNGPSLRGTIAQIVRVTRCPTAHASNASGLKLLS